ncbi:MAG: 6-phosphogluconolactonase [Bacteroidales bacterium]|nr:6-phosphogluconolactonase [Bacteroidales bacterium]
MKHFNLPKDGGLLAASVPQDVLHANDKIYTDVYENSTVASEIIAGKVIAQIKAFEKTNPGELFKLGLTTGATPVSLYKILSKKCRQGEVSFRNVTIFSIDEYYPIAKDAPQSRNRRLHAELLDNIDILPENIHIPNGSLPQEEVSAYCANCDIKAREMDLLVIGFGEEGQIGFNEAGTPEHTRTRTVMMSFQSRKRQVLNFNNDIAATPKMAITIGLSTILSAKKVYLMAWGEDKAGIVRKIVEEEYDPACPASTFQYHHNVHLFVDEMAASLLTREVAPWVIGPCDWTPKFRRKAVVWLCQKVHKPILKLTNEDYLKNYLDGLIESCGPFDKINMEVFEDLQGTITRWPGGESVRKNVVVFSPHPDDDVISMGGTFIRLVHQGHNVHVAYETSGNIAVHDDVVMQHMDAACQLGFGDRSDEVRKLIASKRPGEAEPRELLGIKAAIRRSEARGADRSFGLEDSHIHFLNLPFYESGGIQKLPRSQNDIDIIKEFLQNVRPDQVYLAGDLADPHGTHRVCTEAALEALEQLRDEGEAWVRDCIIWLYRGAWMEWELGRVDMAVPLSPDEVIEKRHAIYHHLSQKDIVPFPGEDPREFWQRAEDRTSRTARLYDELGMPEYQAMEVFVKYKIS